MAVIYERKLEGGGAVRIHDDYAVKTEEEKQAIIDAVSRAILIIISEKPERKRDRSRCRNETAKAVCEDKLIKNLMNSVWSRKIPFELCKNLLYDCFFLHYTYTYPAPHGVYEGRTMI